MAVKEKRLLRCRDMEEMMEDACVSCSSVCISRGNGGKGGTQCSPLLQQKEEFSVFSRHAPQCKHWFDQTEWFHRGVATVGILFHHEDNCHCRWWSGSSMFEYVRRGWTAKCQQWFIFKVSLYSVLAWCLHCCTAQVCLSLGMRRIGRQNTKRELAIEFSYNREKGGFFFFEPHMFIQ